MFWTCTCLVCSSKASRVGNILLQVAHPNIWSVWAHFLWLFNSSVVCSETDNSNLYVPHRTAYTALNQQTQHQSTIYTLSLSPTHLHACDTLNGSVHCSKPDVPGRSGHTGSRPAASACRSLNQLRRGPFLNDVWGTSFICGWTTLCHMYRRKWELTHRISSWQTGSFY